MLSISTESNYLAQVVQLGEPKKHPNADRLQIWDVNGYSVITDLSSKQGDIKIFFPVECQIHHNIISKLNLYSDKELNEDKNISGYIGKQRRVKAVKLREIISEGMLLPYEQVMKCLNIVYADILGEAKQFIGTQFDTIDGVVICQKYIPIIKEVRSGQGQGKPKGPKIADIIVPGQFNFHYSTSKLQDNIWRFDNPRDVVVITAKIHGTSAVFSNILTKKKLSIWQKIKLFFDSDISKTEYKKLYSSRTVIKHIDDRYHTEQQGYYNTDIWGQAFEKIKPFLFEGYTIYAELVGWLYSGKCIQKDYDYGVPNGEFAIQIYRITETDELGNVEEYSWENIKYFCQRYGLTHVPELYYGRISKWLKTYGKKDESFLDSLKTFYLEKDCPYCIHTVPAEGICIRNEFSNMIAYKLKSKAFLLGETAALDAGEEVIE